MWGLHSYMPIKLNGAKSNQQFWSCFSRVGLIFKGYWDLLLETFFILLIPLHNIPSATSWNHGLVLHKTEQQERERCRPHRTRSHGASASWLSSFTATSLCSCWRFSHFALGLTKMFPKWKRFKSSFYLSHFSKSMRSKLSIITSDLPKPQCLALRKWLVFARKHCVLKSLYRSNFSLQPLSPRYTTLRLIQTEIYQDLPSLVIVEFSIFYPGFKPLCWRLCRCSREVLRRGGRGCEQQRLCLKTSACSAHNSASDCRTAINKVTLCRNNKHRKLQSQICIRKILLLGWIIQPLLEYINANVNLKKTL